MAHQDTHKFEQFSANVKDLLGEHPAHSVLAHLCEEEMGSGKGVWLDGISAADSDDATRSALTAKATRMDFHQKAAENQTFANYLLTKTPAQDVSKIRTGSTPQLIEWGHYFDEDEGWQHLTDPKGKEVNVGVRKIHLSRDQAFVAGAIATVVSRKTSDNDTAHNVSLPASQALGDLTFAQISVDTLPNLICEKFDDVWFAKGQPIYCVISAKAARFMRQNSRNLIHSNDFVRSYDNFAKGEIPQIDGVTFVVMPSSFMAAFNGEGAEDNYFSFVTPAITKVTYSGMKVSEGVSPDHRFDTAVYMREKLDFKRTDDLGVVVGDIVAG